jgi:hypothetical protein
MDKCEICGCTAGAHNIYTHQFQKPGPIIARDIGEGQKFEGGAELPIQVAIARYYMPGSMVNSDKAFEIFQEDHRGKMQKITISPQTLEAIIKWGKKE